ncbi:MAG: hypothetical protein RLZ29_112 [Actinomycetota bacterium]
MATIILNGQLRPTSVRPASTRSARGATRRRQALRDAARTREIQRVYRRRRFGLMVLVATVAAAAALSVFSLFGTSAAADGTAGRSVAPKYVVAQAGDTLWSIGERIAPNAPITEVVDELVRLNGTSIQTGQLVRIP